MSKLKTQFSCQSCGYLSPKWLGRCPSCEAWNSMAEEKETDLDQKTSLGEVREVFRSMKSKDLDSEDPIVPAAWTSLADSETGDLKKSSRISTGIRELDRTLGGGLIPDSFTLLGGDPGIGKSTLLLQMAKGLCQTNPELKILYISGEESVDQIRERAIRLGVGPQKFLYLAAETHLENAFESVMELKPQVLIMDSLQTFATRSVQAPQGSTSQVREVTARLMTLAKSAGIAVWLVGHVTKEGSIAGPKTVEHMVDTVLYFEGEEGQSYRLLRTVKNRFGSTRELGVFEMEGEGLREVSNPSSLFLTEREREVFGTAIAATLEGSRPLLVELQSLVTPCGVGIPRRTSVGMDHSRISLLAAILEKHMRIVLSDQDVFFNVSGGLKINEPACDLAAAASIWSAVRGHAIPHTYIFAGELGLTGEVRRVPQTDLRLMEAKRLGFKGAVIAENTPKKSLERWEGDLGFKILKISTIEQLSKLFT